MPLGIERLDDGPLLTRSPGGDEPGVHRFRTEATPLRRPELIYVSFGSEAPSSHHSAQAVAAEVAALPPIDGAAELIQRSAAGQAIR